MFTVSDSVHIHAPIDRCFLLSTHVELTAQALGMEPVAGKTAGTAGKGDTVVLGRWSFGLPHRHESVITRYERPGFFQDTMVRGRFRKYQCGHRFMEIDGHTLVIDKVQFSMPLGWVGRKVGKKLVIPAITKLLRRRMELLKLVAENGQWRSYLVEESVERVSGMEEAVRTA